MGQEIHDSALLTAQLEKYKNNDTCGVIGKVVRNYEFFVFFVYELICVGVLVPEKYYEVIHLFKGRFCNFLCLFVYDYCYYYL